MPKNRPTLQVKVPLPRVLYKYLPLKYAKELLSKGAIRVSTAAYYRNEEDAGAGRQDATEATRTVKYVAPGPMEFTAASPPPYPVNEWINITEATHWRLKEGVSLSMKYDNPNTLVYCMSARFGQDLMKQFHASACVAIQKPTQFFQLVSEHFPLKYSWVALRQCEYRQRTEDVTENSGLHPVFLKPPEYACEKEWRAAWEPVSESQLAGPHVNIVCEALKRCCRLYCIAELS